MNIETNIDKNGIATITMNRAKKHNAFDEVFILELTDAFQTMNADESARLICLKANGKSFSAGADLNWMKKMAAYSWEENYQDSLALASLMSTIANSEKPTIAIVQGSAFGGGVGLVACCDFAIASDAASFCLSEVKLGLIPAVISPYVVKAIGVRESTRYFISAETFSAETATKLGLVSEVVSSADFDKYVGSFLKTISQNAPVAIKEAKKLVKYVSTGPISEDMIRETASKIADRRASLEGVEGVTAFLEKRAANWPVETTNVKDLADGDGDV
jgi:methylglutaconyl-CoA hydratase